VYVGEWEGSSRCTARKEGRRKGSFGEAEISMAASRKGRAKFVIFASILCLCLAGWLLDY